MLAICGLLALAGVVALAAVLTTSATGEIEGTVKNLAGTEVLANVQVCALKVVEVAENPVEPNPSAPTKCTRSNSAGHYAIEGLSQGEYFVDFAPEGDKAGSVVQYYDEEAPGGEATTDWSEASEVEAAANYESAQGIDAKLLEFGATKAG